MGDAHAVAHDHRQRQGTCLYYDDDQRVRALCSRCGATEGHGVSDSDPGNGNSPRTPTLEDIARDAGLPDLTDTSSAEMVRDALHRFATCFEFADREQREAAKRHAASLLRAAGIRAAGPAIHAAFVAAGERAAAKVDACGAASDTYSVQDGRIVRRRATRAGTVTEPLANFDARIVEEVVLDDGVEPSTSLGIEGLLVGGERLPLVRVPAVQYPGMQWLLKRWGPRAIVGAGLGVRDALRAAIQELSPAPTCRHVFTHTGWRRTESGWIYLTAGGAVGQPGYDVELPEELARYSLPVTPTNAIDAMRASLRLLAIAPLSVTVPLLGTIFRAPLAQVVPADYSLGVVGPTGSLKSTLAALFLSHFGPFQRRHLPGWSSTANALEQYAFILKDAVLVVDDFAPSTLDAREMQAKAARVLRAQGNTMGRARLRADLSHRATPSPRGIVVWTGEQTPAGHSVLARTLVIDAHRNQVDLPKLSTAQSTADLLPHAMAAYVRWLGPQMDTKASALRAAFEATRDKATQGIEHLRVPEVLAHIWVGFDAAIQFAEQIGACTSGEAEQLRTQAWDVLLACGVAQAHAVDGERPTRRFLEMLSMLIDQGAVTLVPRGAGPIADRSFVGWRDAEHLLLVPEAAFGAVSRACRDAGEPFAIGQKALADALKRDGLTDCGKGRTTKVERGLGGKNRRVWALRSAALDDLVPTDHDDDSAGDVTAVTGSIG
jgi:hypothetical protein